MFYTAGVVFGTPLTTSKANGSKHEVKIRVRRALSFALRGVDGVEEVDASSAATPSGSFSWEIITGGVVHCVRSTTGYSAFIPPG
jgi:hypothetical protein